MALTEIQIPLTFEHVSSEKEDRLVMITQIPRSSLDTNEARVPKLIVASSLVSPGIYKNIEAMIYEINNFDCLREHVAFNVENGGYVTGRKVCAALEYSKFIHNVGLSKK